MSERRRLATRLAMSRLVLVAVLVAAAVVGFVFLGRATTAHTVTAEFRDADGLVVGNEVRVAGIVAGNVQSVQAHVDPRTGQQYALATLEVNDDHWPLYTGTQVAVKPKGVLSNVFVDIEPASRHNAPLGDGHVFTVDQTQSPVNIQELANVFDADVRSSLRTGISEGTIVLDSGGAAHLNDLLHQANPLSADLTPLTSVLAARTPELDRLNYELDSISGELAREDGNLRGLIQNSDVTLGALAARQDEIKGTLDHASGTLTSLDAGLKGEEPNLAAIFQKSPGTLASAKSASDSLTPLIVSIDPHISNLDILLNELITATGYNNNSSHVDTLRVDGTLPPPGYSSIGCGGEPLENGTQAGCPTQLGAHR